jgi:hypothetical protein
LKLVAREFLERWIDVNRPESNIVEWGGPIYFRNLTATFFQSLLRFLFRRLSFLSR